MVIDRRRKISFHFCTIFTDRKVDSFLDVSLDKHHAVWLTVTFGRTFTCFTVDFHLPCTKSGFIHVPLQCGTLQNPWGHAFFHLKDQDDLFDGAAWDLPAQLDRFLDKFFIIIRKVSFLVIVTCSWFQSFKTVLTVCIHITPHCFIAEIVFFCLLSAQLDIFCLIEGFIQQW